MYNTGNPVPSNTLEDMADNAQVFDALVTKTEGTTTDRLGRTRRVFQQILMDMGFQPLSGSFQTGATITARNQTLYDEVSHVFYSWNGALPKVVAAGSTPATSGGIGAGAWSDKTDLMLRGELSSLNGVDLVNGAAKQSDMYTAKTLADLQNLLSTGKSAKLLGSISVPSTGLPVPSLATLEQVGGAIGFTGNNYLAGNTISKTGNATITLANQDEMAGSATVDAVIYQDPTWPSHSVYPQKTTLHGLGILGDASSPNEAGIYILQGGVLTVDSVDVVNCVNGLLAKDLFLSDVRKLHTLGKIRIDNGTSVTLTDCWAKGHTSRAGAFDFTGLKYSVLNGCGSDRAPNTAYVFSHCQGVSINGCGCEGAETITPDRGTALAFTDENTITVNGFTCVPIANQGPALITVGEKNKISIKGFYSNFGANNNTDIYVYGSGSTIDISYSKFYNGRDPVVQIAVGSTSVVLYHKADGNIIKYTAPNLPGLAMKEAFYDAGTWVPELSFDHVSTGITYTSRSGTWVKNGNSVTFHGSLKLSSKGSAAGVALISGLWFVSKGHTASKPDIVFNILNGPFLLTTGDNAQDIFIIKDTATGTNNATNLDLSDKTFMSFSITYIIRDSVFE